MTSHMWGDKDFNWADLHSASLFVSNFVKWVTGCNVCYKEKYGNLIIEYVFPPYGGMFYRNWIHEQWVNSRLYGAWAALGWRACWVALRLATKRWPHIEDELVSDFAAHEWIVGKEVHDKYWRRFSE